MANFGRFNIKIPFSVADITQLIHYTNGAMVDDGTPYSGFEGPLARVLYYPDGHDLSSVILLAVYDKNKNLLPGNVSAPFVAGDDEGYFLVQLKPNVPPNFAIGCASLDPNEAVLGASNTCQITGPPPPPPTGHRVVVHTDPAKVAVDGVLVWAPETEPPGTAHVVTTRTGTQPSVAVDGVPVWP